MAPKKDVLVEEVGAAMQQDGIDMSFPSNRLPDVDWLVKVLSTLRPNHRFFMKDYVPRGRESRLNRGKTEADKSEKVAELTKGLKIRRKGITKSRKKNSKPIKLSDDSPLKDLDKLRETKRQITA